MDSCRIRYTGGQHSPYIWFECPGNMNSWDFFDLLLREIQVVGTPGEGFGDSGKKFFRLTAFNTHENTAEAMRRFRKLMNEKFARHLQELIQQKTSGNPHVCRISDDL